MILNKAIQRTFGRVVSVFPVMPETRSRRVAGREPALVGRGDVERLGWRGRNRSLLMTSNSITGAYSSHPPHAMVCGPKEPV